ncbi:hypothetical protein D9613_009046 [Agrocybe pediades]|uniref:Spindle assembly checkpoint component MAD1 n=1 Tax=Agrocybe pediades TaxID=84607 RepID=A0A8H4VUF9_9AGAR|nr:hypothetical protein D9613_009046 [Agrocybe pediades]
MDWDSFKTPLNKSRLDVSSSSIPSSIRSNAVKRDSLAAELERDPQLSSAKRHQRAQVFSSTISHASLERQLLAAQTAKLQLETKLREKELLVERLERDRRYFADREKEEREEKEREREGYEQAKKAADQETRTLRLTLSSLREELADLQDTHTSLTRTTSQTIASQKTQISSLTHEVTLLADQHASFKLLAEDRGAQLSALQAAYDDLLSSTEKESRLAQDEESLRVVREEMARQAGYVRNLETSNARMKKELGVLRERSTSVEVLREEKRGLERRIAMLEELRTKVVQLQAEVDAGRREREAWASAATSSSSPAASADKPGDTPISITQTLSELRLAHARLLEEHGATSALLRQRETQLKEYEEREGQAKKALAALEQNLRAARDKIARKETRALLAEREVSFLQALVASYNAEEAHLASSSSQEQGQAHVIDEAKNTRIQQLETLLKDYKETNEKLWEEVDALGGKAALQGRQGNEGSAEGEGEGAQGDRKVKVIEELEKERKERKELEERKPPLPHLPPPTTPLTPSSLGLTTLESTTQTYLTQIDTLEQTLFELRGEIAGGRHVPPGVRVLSMKGNPEEEWFGLRQAAMDRLKGENEALMRRLRELEEVAAAAANLSSSSKGADGEGGGGAGGDGQEEGEGDGEGARKNGKNVEELVPRESWELVNREKMELEDQLKQKEKRLLRLQQVFASKSAEFREAIASILGLKLAFYPNGQVRVTSMYDLSASFVFQPASRSSASSSSSNAGGTMQLIAQGEGGPQDLPSLMQYWVEKEQCIPGFLASVTLECWEGYKRTREGEEGWMVEG